MASKRQRGSGAEKGEALRPPNVGARTGAEKLDIVTRAEGLKGEELGQFLRREGVHLTELELTEGAIGSNPRDSDGTAKNADSR